MMMMIILINSKFYCEYTLDYYYLICIIILYIQSFLQARCRLFDFYIGSDLFYYITNLIMIFLPFVENRFDYDFRH